jgi:urease accessory protein
MKLMKTKHGNLSKLQFILIAASLFVPTLAMAHVGVGPTTGLLRGFVHPMTGLDHVCAMVAVGLWASQMGGRAIWVVPLTFVTMMACGAAIGMAGLSGPIVERGIVISVLALGVLIAAAVRLPLVAGALLVGLFALFHGHAHGTEMPATASGLVYGAGFILATASLHACGIATGLILQKSDRGQLIRFAGMAIAVCGLYRCLA